MTFGIATLGCKVNQYESGVLERELTALGFTAAAFRDFCDIYIINTCTVTATADSKSRQMLHGARRRNPSALIVAMGCSAEIGDKARLGDADLLILNRDKAGAAAQIAAAAKGREASRQSGSEPPHDKTRAYVKIGDGCDNFCSYCIIPYARGRVQSRPIADIVAECRRLADAGYREIVLTAIEIASFGKDSGERLTDLLSALDKALCGKARLRLGSLEPRVLTDEFIALCAKSSVICPHFHLSLQSGSDTVLRRMNRHYDTAFFADACRRLRAAMPLCGITTDVIVGFPGETAEEFAETAAFVKEVGFSRTHIFPYSRRAGTRADKMPGQLAKAEKAARAAALEQAAALSVSAFLRQMVGKTLTLLPERLSADGVAEGYTENYCHARCALSAACLNTPVTVRVVGVSGESLLCEKA